MDWRHRAACQGMDTELWFPNETAHIRDPRIPIARAVCGACPVWASCLEYALENPLIAKGIYGGLLERERKNLKRASGHPDPMVRERAVAARFGFYQETLPAASNGGVTTLRPL